MNSLKSHDVHLRPGRGAGWRAAISLPVMPLQWPYWAMTCFMKLKPAVARFAAACHSLRGRKSVAPTSLMRIATLRNATIKLPRGSVAPTQRHAALSTLPPHISLVSNMLRWRQFSPGRRCHHAIRQHRYFRLVVARSMDICAIPSESG